MIDFPKRARLFKRETAIHRSYLSRCKCYRIVHIEPYSKALSARWMAIHCFVDGQGPHRWEGEENIGTTNRIRSKEHAMRICDQHAECKLSST